MPIPVSRSIIQIFNINDEWILNRIVRVISSNQKNGYSREAKASKRELYDGGLLTQFNNNLSVSHNFHAVAETQYSFQSRKEKMRLQD